MSIGLPETITQEFFDIVEYGKLQRDWYTEIFSLFKKMNSAQGQLDGTKPTSPPIPALPDNDYVALVHSPKHLRKTDIREQ